MAIARYCYREVLPFTAMVMVECSTVGLNTLFKAATLRGMSYYVFVFYSSVIATLVLLPFALISYRRTMLPPIKFSVSSKFCLLGLLGFLAQISGFKGIEYSSPTLDSAISNLTPAFTFILAIFFRLEKLNLRSSSTLAKVIGTILSISGALLVVLYKGSAILGISQLSSPYHSLRLSVSNWATGGLLLSAEYILISFWYIIQAQVMKAYPAELVSVFFYNLSATIISAPVCLLAETNLSAWRLTDNVALVATVYAGLFGSSFGTFVHTWGLHMKGPVYIALFKPLSIAIAAAMGIIFLGDTLYLGSVIGAVIISIGFYVAIWGKAKEENDEEVGTGNASLVASQSLPLLQEDMKGEEV